MTLANHMGASIANSAPVVLAAEVQDGRIGRMRARHVSDARGQSLAGRIRACVEPRAAVPADGWSGYTDLEKAGCPHRRMQTLQIFDLPRTLQKFGTAHQRGRAHFAAC